MRVCSGFVTVSAVSETSVLESGMSGFCLVHLGGVAWGNKLASCGSRGRFTKQHGSTPAVRILLSVALPKIILQICFQFAMGESEEQKCFEVDIAGSVEPDQYLTGILRSVERISHYLEAVTDSIEGTDIPEDKQRELRKLLGYTKELASYVMRVYSGLEDSLDRLYEAGSNSRLLSQELTKREDEVQSLSKKLKEITRQCRTHKDMENELVILRKNKIVMQEELTKCKQDLQTAETKMGEIENTLYMQKLREDLSNREIAELKLKLEEYKEDYRVLAKELTMKVEQALCQTNIMFDFVEWYTKYARFGVLVFLMAFVIACHLPLPEQPY